MVSTLVSVRVFLKEPPEYLVDIDWGYVPIPFSDDYVAIAQAVRNVVEDDYVIL